MSWEVGTKQVQGAHCQDCCTRVSRQKRQGAAEHPSEEAGENRTGVKGRMVPAARVSPWLLKGRFPDVSGTNGAVGG